MFSVSVAHALAAHARACKSHGPDSPEAIAARYRLRVERAIDRVRALVSETPRLTEGDRGRLLEALEPLLANRRSSARPESDRVGGDRS